MTPSPSRVGVLTTGESLGLVVTDGPLHERRTRVGFGGAESNVAIALARLGTPVSWIGRIGDDAFGDLIERELRAEGVATTALRSTTHATGLMVKERRAFGRSRVRYYRSTSAATTLTADDVPDDVLRSSATVHLTGITAAISPTARAAVLDIAHRASDVGVPVSFDLNYRGQLWDRPTAAAFYARILPLVDIVFAGDDEAGIVVGDHADPATLARALRDLGPREAVIKLGAAGAVASDAHGTERQEALAVTAVDTVGAGDGFVAGYLSERLQGATTRGCLVTGVQVGAFACLGAGDWESMPRRSDLLLVDQNGAAAAEVVDR